MSAFDPKRTSDLAACHRRSRGESLLVLENISSRCGGDSGMAVVTKRLGRIDLLARPFVQPVPPIKPPASLPLFRTGGKPVGSSRIDGPDYIGCFFVGGRIEKALQMSAVR